MPPRQHNALNVNPDALPMRVAGRYDRVVCASIARAWENVRDWEHLPYLHANSFSQCLLEEEGDWGWRATTKGVGQAADQTSVIEVAIDAKASRYVSRTLEGGLPGVEIWTQLTVLGDRQTRVEVEFHLPHLTELQAAKAGENLLHLYTQLWDEDEAMMIARQEALDARDGRMRIDVALGAINDLRTSLPRLIETESGPVCIREFDSRLVAFPARCPHLKAPLQDLTPDQSGTITCPWHGYKFSITTGQSTDGRGLQLGLMPRVEVDDRGEAMLRW
ncbi:MAG: Rieske 2Fe-2S domain-containing protein [Parvibaculum sp.]|nr:Rieske 2Fe-2S domain-containing protein [Parvibaculum sp.]